MNLHSSFHFRYTYVSKQLPIFLQVQLLEPVLT